MTHIPDEAVQAREKIEKIAKYFINEGSRDYTQEICYALKNVGLELLDALNTLPHLSAPCAVEVKKLEWFDIFECGLDYRAETSIGTYSIHTDEDSAGGRMFCYFHLTEDADCTKYGHEIYSGYGGDDEAKAAAQADFDRRILSCVVTKPVDVAAVRRQAFEEGFENGVEQSLDALNAYDDITRNEAEQAIRKLTPDYRALSAEPAQGDQWDEDRRNRASFNLTMAIRAMTEGEWEPSIHQSFKILEAALTAAPTTEAGK